MLLSPVGGRLHEHIQLLQYDRKQLGGRWCSDRKDLHKLNRVRLHIPLRTQPNASISSYAFNQANQFVNRGETSHAVILALPSAVVLPNPTQPAFPMNAIFIATSMGNVFSFQWPFQVQVFGQSQSAYSQGIMKVAYQGTFDSKNEPGPVAGGSAGQSALRHKDIATKNPCNRIRPRPAMRRNLQ